jgi:RNA polymerase sigma factor (TIGR02999 family)
MAAPSEVTQLLVAWRQGDDQAAHALAPLIYGELHRMARNAMRRERPDHTLQATALVHEAFLDLAGAEVQWVDRVHFFAVAARQIRRILVSHGRARRADKRGGGQPHLPLDEALELPGAPSAEIIELDDALSRLARWDARKAQALELHYFGGMTYEEIGAALQLSTTTVELDLRVGKAWLKAQLEDPPAA